MLQNKFYRERPLASRQTKLVYKLAKFVTCIDRMDEILCLFAKNIIKYTLSFLSTIIAYLEQIKNRMHAYKL